MLDMLEVSHTFSASQLEHFTCLYFAPAKCLATASSLSVAEKILNLRSANSLKLLKIFAQENPAFEGIVNLGYKLIDEQKYPVTYNQLVNLSGNLYGSEKSQLK